MSAELYSFTNSDPPSYLFLLLFSTPWSLSVSIMQMGPGAYEHDLGWTLVTAQTAYPN